MMLALGRTEDPKQIDLLLETTTRSHHDELRAASGEALGNFKKAKTKQKREIVKDIVRAWGSLHSLATQPEPTDPRRTRQFRAAERPAHAAGLRGQVGRDAAEADRHVAVQLQGLAALAEQEPALGAAPAPRRPASP